MEPAAARRLLLERFRWVSGHADVWQIFSDAGALGGVVGALVEPYRSLDIAAVVGVESRGFLLGGAAARPAAGARRRVLRRPPPDDPAATSSG